MKKKTKIGIGLSTVLVAFILVFMLAQSFAAGSKYLNIVGEREGGETYTLPNVSPEKTVWKIIRYENETSTTPLYDEAIYCVNPEVGFGNFDTVGARTEYNYSFNMKNLTGLEQQYRDLFTDQTKYNSILWILDNCYLPKQTPEADRLLNKQTLYAAAGIDRDVLTDNDFEVVQQLAIWYFASNTGKYHYEPEDFPTIEINDTVMTSIGMPESTIGRQRYNDMQVLYEYLIDSAKANQATYGTGDKRELKAPSISFTKPADNTTSTTLESIAGTDYLVAGPFNFSETNHSILPYLIEGSVLDQDNNAIPTTTYKLLDSTKTILNDNTIDKALLDTDFYIALPADSTVTKVIVKLKTSYTTTSATLWTHTTNYATEQPVVILEKTPQEDEVTSEVTVITPKFDLSLRKFITKINDVEPEVSREPVVDATPLKDGSGTTAIYTHPKTPLYVKTGDLVTYTIRIYNEGEVPGYAKEITDNIPEGLKFVVDNEVNREYMWKLSEDGTKITTDYLSMTTDDDNLIPSFNKARLTEPAHKDVKVVFEVIEPNTSDRTLINIAEISDDSDQNGNPVTDRDSTPNNNVENEDDIDKEYLKLKAFDLALRKFITKVNETAITTRVPQVNVTDLKDGTSTTAKYTHPKDPVLVKTGDVVVYTIRIFNEGEISGYAEEITDDVPEGLRFIENHPINMTYKWTASTDGKKITTTYLSKTENEDNLIECFEKATMNTLNYKDVQVAFEVIEPNGSDKTLVNIAEISEDADQDGKPVEDRDSTPNNNVETEDDLDKEYLKLKPEEKYFDLALRKFITQVNEEAITSREPKVDVSEMKDGVTTAKYTHPKDPVLVRTGDIVTYTIRVYNEGEISGYAEEITDDVPEGLKFLPDNKTNKEYKWKVSEDGTKITTTYLSKASNEGNVIGKFDKETMTTLNYKDVKVVFEVIEPNNSEKTLINIAEISDDADEEGNPVEDIDSIPNNNKEDEDDLDKEYLKLEPEKYFDLSLRKFITKVNEEEVTSREPQVDVSGLKGRKTTATYTHPKTAVSVKTGDIVVYTIRVYNEGEIDGYAEEITDNIPEGLEFIVDHEVNKEYMWKLSKDGKKITTTYLSKETDENNLIEKFDKDSMTTLNYKDVKVAFEVIEPNTSDKTLINIAEISDDADKDGNPVEDRDSTPNNNVETEDDLDKEYLKLGYFDLSLRKFITKVNEEEVTTRYPVVSMDDDGELKYEHPKDPVVVSNNNVVVYTIRVYNEGTTAGYASEVTDDIPDGLVYLPKHEINTKYEWEVSEDGKTVSTDYLSKEKSEARQEDNLLKGFKRNQDISDENPDYRDLQIAFKVTETNLATNRIIINTAEITDDSDADGNPVEDIDSTPGNNKEDEDDIDKEYLKVKYFDLSLLKWVSKTIVTENGKTKETKTGHTGLERPEPIVKVELYRKNIKNVTVKFEYTIKITNEGEIEGYAKEISDYIPAGLKFVKADNPDWEEKDGKIVTSKLANTLLKPGQSATVKVILTWINDENNMGTKVNVAEISKDYNKDGAKDIDSTPDNKKEGEDDIDDAPVMLAVQTGSAPTYVVLALASLTILTTGVILIKKYVLG